MADFIEAVDKNRDGFIDYREYMDVLGPFHGQSDSGDVIEGNVITSTNSYDKVAPYGADEIREVMVARKQRDQAVQREERLRKQT